MTRYRNLMPAAFLAAVIYCLSANPGFACSCTISPSPEAQIEGADIIFRGTLIQRRPHLGWFSLGTRGASFLFKAKRVWKGPEFEYITISTFSTDEGLCGIDFPVGWSGVVFASGNGWTAHTGACRHAYRNPVDDTGAFDELLPGHRESR